jgi:hypothetical protein
LDGWELEALNFLNLGTKIGKVKNFKFLDFHISVPYFKNPRVFFLSVL